MGHTIFFLDSNTAMKIDPEEYKGEDDLQATALSQNSKNS